MPLRRLPMPTIDDTPRTMDDLVRKSRAPISPTPPPITRTVGTRRSINWKKIASDLDKAAPFASNIINSFRMPPKPRLPHLDSFTGGTRRINMDSDRAMVERGIRSSNMAADNNLDENTAASIRQANKAQREGSLGKINETERNANIGIDTQNARLEAETRARNNLKLDQFDNNVVERGVAIQNNASANFANASDKYIGIKNQKALQDLEDKKIRLFYDTDKGGTGVSTRQKARMDAGVDPNTNQPISGDNQIFNFTGETTTIPSAAPTKQKNAFEPLKVPNTYWMGMPRQSTRVRFKALGGPIKKFNSKRMMSVHR